MKKGDIAIIVIIFLIAIIFGNYVSMGKIDGTKTVIIVKDNKEIHKYKIDKNYENTIKIDTEDEINIIKIKDGKVSITQANCHDELCVKSHEISKSGEMIVCLPHKLYVKIYNDTQESAVNKKIDAIVN